MWWKDYGSPGCWDEMLRAGRPHDACSGVMRYLDSLGPELLDRQQAADLAIRLGLECHAGHGLGFDTVGPVAAIAAIVELNIGHFLIGEAIFGGLGGAVTRMRALMQEARGREKSA